MIKFALLSVALSLFCGIGLSGAQERPKAVSLDYCADQFLLALADREQITGLTRDATGEDSFYRGRARGLPLFGATAEEVLYNNPDIVIRSWGGYNMLPLLRRARLAVVSTQYGDSPEILYHNLRLVGAALDQKRRAEEMISGYQHRLDEIKRRATHSPVLKSGLRAIYITPGGVTAGRNTSVNAIIKLAGLTSIAEQLGLEGWPPVPLEALIENPPDLIIASFFDQDNIHVSGWSLSRHRRIRKMLDNIPTIMVPGRYLSCDGIFAIEAAEYIQREVAKTIK